MLPATDIERKKEKEERMRTNVLNYTAFVFWLAAAAPLFQRPKMCTEYS